MIENYISSAERKIVILLNEKNIHTEQWQKE